MTWNRKPVTGPGLHKIITRSRWHLVLCWVKIRGGDVFSHKANPNCTAHPFPIPSQSAYAKEIVHCPAPGRRVATIATL